MLTIWGGVDYLEVFRSHDSHEEVFMRLTSVWSWTSEKHVIFPIVETEFQLVSGGDNHYLTTLLPQWEIVNVN